MKYLQIGTFGKLKTRGFWVRLKVRVLKKRKSVRGKLPANTRILDASTHGCRPPLARETPA
jgi:hypothetical protein